MFSELVVLARDSDTGWFLIHLASIVEIPDEANLSLSVKEKG